MFEKRRYCAREAPARQTHASARAQKTCPWHMTTRLREICRRNGNCKRKGHQAANKRNGELFARHRFPRPGKHALRGGNRPPRHVRPQQSMLSGRHSKDAGPMSPKKPHEHRSKRAPASRMVHTISSGSGRTHPQPQGNHVCKVHSEQRPADKKHRVRGEITEAMCRSRRLSKPVQRGNKTAMASESPQSSGMLMRGNEPRERTSKNAAHKAPNTYDMSVNEHERRDMRHRRSEKHLGHEGEIARHSPQEGRRAKASRICASSACSIVAARRHFFSRPHRNSVEQAKRLLSRVCGAGLLANNPRTA